jgi:hypothetical protein
MNVTMKGSATRMTMNTAAMMLLVRAAVEAEVDMS